MEAPDDETQMTRRLTGRVRPDGPAVGSRSAHYHVLPTAGQPWDDLADLLKYLRRRFTIGKNRG